MSGVQSDVHDGINSVPRSDAHGGVGCGAGYEVVCLEVVLTIPDNEARTALRTLQRLGVAVYELERADVYRCEVESSALARIPSAFRSIETLFNPNKHALRVLLGGGPQAGEAWISERSSQSARAHDGDSAARAELAVCADRVQCADGPQAGAAFGQYSSLGVQPENDVGAARARRGDGVDCDEHTDVRIAGRSLPGLRRFERFVGWRLFGENGRPADWATVAAATETLLYNPAFQKVTTA